MESDKVVSNFSAPPMSRAKLEALTCEIRRVCLLEDVKYFPVLRFIENILPRIEGFEDVYLEPVPDGELSHVEGFRPLLEQKIVVPESTYQLARQGHERSRFTIAHELGHILLHPPEVLTLNRNTKVEKYCDPEWQANYFAGAILAPEYLLRTYSDVRKVSEDFGISFQAAQVRLDKIK